jgi:hypothetical protein
MWNFINIHCLRCLLTVFLYHWFSYMSDSRTGKLEIDFPRTDPQRFAGHRLKITYSTVRQRQRVIGPTFASLRAFCSQRMPGDRIKLPCSTCWSSSSPSENTDASERETEADHTELGVRMCGHLSPRPMQCHSLPVWFSYGRPTWPNIESDRSASLFCFREVSGLTIDPTSAYPNGNFSRFPCPFKQMQAQYFKRLPNIS